MTRYIILLVAFVGIRAWAGSVRKEPVSVVAVRDEQNWMIRYQGTEPWKPGQEVYLGIPMEKEKPRPIGLFVVEHDRGNHRFQLKLTLRMGAFRKGKAGENLVAVFKLQERDPAAVSEAVEPEPTKPVKPVKGSARMQRRTGI